MCRFLLSKHADVDVQYYVTHELCDEHCNSLEHVAPILHSGVNLFEASAEEVVRVQECCRLLLDAGADPTDGTEFSGVPFFDIFTKANVVSTMAGIFFFYFGTRGSGGSEV
jgi:hypothetical protein